jgi:co-chaperonin GroES (HSP10)
MNLRPLGHRLVILPDQPVTETESGLYIPDAYQDTPAMSGIVQRVGDGSFRDRRIRTASIARCLSILETAYESSSSGVEAFATAREEMARYMADIEDVPHVAEAGQRVIFPMEAGHEIVLGEDTEGAVVIVSEDSILAVYDNEVAAA